MTKLTGQTPDLAQENIARLKTLFPDVFEEGKIDFEKLKQDLGEYVDDAKERYNFSWNGKGRALRLAQTPSTGTLRPCPGESREWDTTQNLYIEGDNLEVLKLLQKSYHGKVKMIYIDPPYNTGGDFVYPDDFSDGIVNYKRITGQIDSEGKKISTNTEANGRYHTDWLNMMYPRLRLARNLLRDDGIIFISIDDNEHSNLKRICDEVFGSDNFISTFIWKRRVPSALSGTNWSVDHEYVIGVRKTPLADFRGIDKNYANYSNPDNDPRGDWMADNLTVGMTSTQRPNQAYDLVNPKNGDVFPYNPNRVWAFIPASMNKMIEDNRIVFPESTSQRPMQKRFKNELRKENNPFSTIMLDEVGLNREATQQLQDLMGHNFFNYSKPLSLLRTLTQQVCIGMNDLVLDFFSGSATTAHAVMQLNAMDGGYRKYIMVQLPETTDPLSEAYKVGYKNICEIGKERIRRAGDKIKAEIEEQSAQMKFGEEPRQVPDIGFKVFKLDSSNLKKWNGEVAYRQGKDEQLKFDAEKLSEYLSNSVDNYMPGRTELDVVYEIMLKLGLDLTYPVEQRQIAGKNVYSIGYGALMMCMDDDITIDVATGMAALYKELKPETWKVVFKDNGFKDDSAKTNVLEILKAAGLEEEAFTTV